MHVASVAGRVDVVDFHGEIELHDDPRRRHHAAHHHRYEQRTAAAKHAPDILRQPRVRRVHVGLAPDEIRFLEHPAYCSDSMGQLRALGAPGTWPRDARGKVGGTGGGQARSAIEAPESGSMRPLRSGADTATPIRFIVRMIAFEPRDPAVALECEHVCRDPIEEPAVM